MGHGLGLCHPFFFWAWRPAPGMAHPSRFCRPLTWKQYENEGLLFYEKGSGTLMYKLWSRKEATFPSYKSQGSLRSPIKWSLSIEKVTTFPPLSVSHTKSDSQHICVRNTKERRSWPRWSTGNSKWFLRYFPVKVPRHSLTFNIFQYRLRLRKPWGSKEIPTYQY
jgi:hypothetical protein